MDDLINLYDKVKGIYERYYDIHVCREDEIEDVIAFIDRYWQKGHILTKSRALLDWQHYDKNHGRYNFVLARSKKDYEIHGLIGFILSSVYDVGIENPIRWGAIWKVRNDVAVKGLGLALKGYMEENIPVQYIGGVGLSKYSKEIDAKLGERMGKLQQYYIANPDIEDYKLVSNPEHSKLKSDVRGKKFRCIDEDSYEEAVIDLKDKIAPYKSVQYFVNRYFRHPIYQYQCIGIENECGETEAVFFYRKAEAEDTACLFIVDYIGDGSELSGLYGAFVDLLRNESAEYISFPCDGISDYQMRQAGFCLREDSEVILPVYYEPFAQMNVDLDFHFWSKAPSGNVILVKGDADQDRPSRIMEKNNG